MHDKRFILCRQIELATPGNRKKAERKTDSQCSALAGKSQVAMTAAAKCGFEFEPWNEISNNVCATSKASDQPAHTCSLIRAFASHLNIIRVLSY